MTCSSLGQFIEAPGQRCIFFKVFRVFHLDVIYTTNIVTNCNYSNRKLKRKHHKLYLIYWSEQIFVVENIPDIISCQLCHGFPRLPGSTRDVRSQYCQPYKPITLQQIVWKCIYKTKFTDYIHNLRSVTLSSLYGQLFTNWSFFKTSNIQGCPKPTDRLLKRWN